MSQISSIFRTPPPPIETPKSEKKEPMSTSENPFVVIDMPLNNDFESVKLQKAIAGHDKVEIAKALDEIKDILKENPLFLNTPMDNGFHPLHYAIQVADEPVIRQLIDAGCNPLTKDAHFNNAFEYAALLGKDRILGQLIAKHTQADADKVMQTIDLVNRRNGGPMFNAAYQQVLNEIANRANDMELAKKSPARFIKDLNHAQSQDELRNLHAYLTQPLDASGIHFIHLVAAANNAPLFKFLVKDLGVNPNTLTKNEDGFNPAHFLAAATTRYAITEKIQWQAFIESGLNPLEKGIVSAVTFFGLPAKENDPLKMDHISNLTLVCSLLFLIHSAGLLAYENKDAPWLINTFTALGIGGLVGRAVWRHTFTHNFTAKLQRVVVLLRDPTATKEALTSLATLIAPPAALASSLFFAYIMPSKLGPEQDTDFSFRERFAVAGEAKAIINAGYQFYNNFGYRTKDAAKKCLKEAVVGITTIGITALGFYARKAFSAP